MSKPRVAILRTSPQTVLDDYQRLADLAGLRDALVPGKTTILKDNISWHFPFPGANTTPWQMEGNIRALRAAGFGDLVCVQNRTVVTNAFKGTDLNGYWPICKAYGVPVKFNFKPEDMSWVEYRPKAKMLVLDRIFDNHIKIPDYFFGKNIVHQPTVKCVAGDTELLLADGSVTTIRDLVAKQMTAADLAVIEPDGSARVRGSVRLLGMSATGEVRPFEATYFWKTSAQGRRVLRVRTRTGREITATDDHPIWTPEGWVKLGDLAVGGRVAAARRSRVAGCAQPLPRTSATATMPAAQARASRECSVEGVPMPGRTVTVSHNLPESTGIAWDIVAEIEEAEPGEVDLYDVTVPEAHCFIGNGLVVHNCHIYTQTTGAMKNAFGGLLSEKRHWTHTWIHETLVDLLAIQKEIHGDGAGRGLFAFMDGTTAGNGAGPRIMKPETKNVILASADQTAIDAVAARLMGWDPLGLKYIRLAHEAGLGVGDPREIEIVGDADAAEENWHFKLERTFLSTLGWLSWFGPTRHLQKLVFHGPLAGLTYPVSELHHDWYRWPFRERKVYERWLVTSPWGRLFQEYRERGHLADPAGV